MIAFAMAVKNGHSSRVFLLNINGNREIETTQFFIMGSDSTFGQNPNLKSKPRRN